MKPNKVTQVLDRHKQLVQDKQPWMTTWQMVGEYVMSRKQNFTATLTPGEFTTKKIFDSTAPNANHTAASAVLGHLYPNASKSFRITAKIKGIMTMDEATAMSDKIKKYFEKVDEIISNVMDNPRAGLITSLQEYMTDQFAFGTSGIGVWETNDPSMPITFTAIDVKKMSIAEGADGFVDTCYIEKEMTIRQLVQEYGLDSVSKASADAFNNGQFDKKVKVLQAIEPRLQEYRKGFGSAGMPVASLHVEIEARKILRESGFAEMPVFITRFWKSMGEIYGRSPAIESMPDIIMLNAMSESSIRATEKLLNPPVWVTDDGTLGNGVKTGPGEITVRKISGRINDLAHKPVEPIFTVGEPNAVYGRIEAIQKTIIQNYFIDRLLDLNNDTRMTLGEANIRNELRGQSLGTIYSRQISELFSRLIERVFNILWNKGYLGVSTEQAELMVAHGADEPKLIIPDEIYDAFNKDQEAYEIQYISPAARIMRAEELVGIQKFMGQIIETAQITPDIVDNIDVDVLARTVQDLTGAPSNIIKAPDIVAKLRDERAAAMQKQAQIEQENTQADTQKAVTQAAANMSKAGGYLNQQQGAA